MSNVAKVLKEEIIRLAKKETKAYVQPLKAEVIKLKKSNVALRRIVKQLQKDSVFLLLAENKRQLSAPVIATGKIDKARITSKGVKALRRKLGVTQAEFARLVGVSMMSVAGWEAKSGALRVKAVARTGLLSLRGLTKKEAMRKLELLAVKKGKKAARKRAK